jgi:phosphoribosylglycinamide formyltransferase-1
VTLRVGVCVSGRGTNLQALLDACRDGRLDAEIMYVGASRKQAPALERARAAGVPAEAFPPAANGGRDAAQVLMAARLAAAGVDLVVLAGYDRILCDAFFARLGDVPVINVHPSLLPAFAGLNGLQVHAAVLAAGVAETGCTVHRAHAGTIDEGEILEQRRVPVLPGDDPATLEARVLAAEHAALVAAVGRFARAAGRGGAVGMPVAGTSAVSGHLADTTVLVVDDDPSIAELLRAVLAEEGYQVRLCADGAEALAAVRTARPDVMLLDIGMPVVNGIEFVKAYREEVEPPYAPIIIISARGDAQAVAADLDCDGYINKPFKVEDVLAAVADALARRGRPVPEHTYRNSERLAERERI